VRGTSLDVNLAAKRDAALATESDSEWPDAREREGTAQKEEELADREVGEF
jgi:hypothetical protein